METLLTLMEFLRWNFREQDLIPVIPSVFANPTAPSGPPPLGGLAAAAPSARVIGIEIGRGTENAPSASEGHAEGGAADQAAGANSTGILVNLTQEPSTNGDGLVAVSVPKGIATFGSSFSFVIPARAVPYEADGSIEVTSANGEALPNWLKFLPESMSFVASAVPGGSFPLRVWVTKGKRRTMVVVSERGE